MPRRCVLATAQGHLPSTAGDGGLGAHRRRLLRRAAGRVLDLSATWRQNLPAYDPGAVTSLVVTSSPGPSAPDDGLPQPELASGLAGTATGAFDTVVLAFTLCTVDDPAQLLSDSAERLVPGGQLLVFEHVGGTGLTGMVQQVTNPVSWAFGAGCRFDLDVPAAAQDAGLSIIDCARFRLWVASAVPTPCLAGVLVPSPSPVSPDAR